MSQTMPLVKTRHKRSKYSISGDGDPLGSYPLGAYALSPWTGVMEPLIDTVYRCPYCQGILNTPDTTRALRRIVTVLQRHDNDNWTVLSAAIPSTHIVLRCEPCDARFVGPRDPVLGGKDAA